MCRTVLVTGGSRGLGAVMVRQLAAEGHRVALNFHASRARAEALCAELTGKGLQVAPFAADVRDEHQVRTLVREVVSAFGPVEVLVVNATGHQSMLPLEEQTWQSYLDQLEFFVKSPLLLAQEVLSSMKASSFGRIVQIGSEVVELGNPRFANYVAAKAAQLGQTRSWARELGPFGITVNLVAPGWVPTERSVDATAQEKELYRSGVPMERFGLAEEVAAVVTFLASDRASFVNGQKIAVNGGNTLA